MASTSISPKAVPNISDKIFIILKLFFEMIVVKKEIMIPSVIEMSNIIIAEIYLLFTIFFLSIGSVIA